MQFSTYYKMSYATSELRLANSDVHGKQSALLGDA